MQFFSSKTFKKIRMSYATIKHKNNFYTGAAKCSPDDHWSEFTGCRYAEMRANIKALKDEYKQKKMACEECRKFVNAVMQYKIFNREDPSARAMFRQLNRRIREVNKLADKITALELELKVSIRMQNSISRKIKNS